LCLKFLDLFYKCFKKYFPAMIDSVGGPVRVNNLLSTLNVPTISNARLKEMERRTGAVVEQVTEKIPM